MKNDMTSTRKTLPGRYSAIPPALLIDQGDIVQIDVEGRVKCKCEVCGKKFTKDKLGKEYADS